MERIFRLTDIKTSEGKCRIFYPEDIGEGFLRNVYIQAPI